MENKEVFYVQVNREILKRLFALLVLTVLLYVFLASPLMVECIRTDGRHLIEIVGFDPCYVSHDAIHSPEVPGAEVTAIAVQSESEGSCTDRFFENPRYTRQSLHRIISSRLIFIECEWTSDARIIDCDYEPIRNDPPSRSSMSTPKLNLRI